MPLSPRAADESWEPGRHRRMRITEAVLAVPLQAQSRNGESWHKDVSLVRVVHLFSLWRPVCPADVPSHSWTAQFCNSRPCSAATHWSSFWLQFHSCRKFPQVRLELISKKGQGRDTKEAENSKIKQRAYQGNLQIEAESSATAGSGTFRSPHLKGAGALYLQRVETQVAESCVAHPC